MQHYRSIFKDYLASIPKQDKPEGLYAPVHYILQLGGKRIRPILTLMATEAYEGVLNQSLSAALAVELFHNFTLMHDDIMDEAPLRRGKQTVHEKWDLNTGILSGDALLIKAYQALEEYPDELHSKLTRLLSQTALEVCEGQQYDIDFEQEQQTNIAAYLEMIRLKTAVLVGCALKMGAYIAGVTESESQKIYDFGIALGMAFQIQDDYLDAFGDPKSFGKQLGGDIIENKKTILYHKALLLGSKAQQKELRYWFETTVDSKAEEKIEAVKKLFIASSAAEASQALMQNYTRQAFELLEGLAVSEKGKKQFNRFANQLMQRQF